jgi:Flp pilus assembly pilin Flp
VDDRGSSAVEFAILFPIIVVLLLGGTQTAMWYFGREVAQAAAEAGARGREPAWRPTRRRNRRRGRPTWTDSDTAR